MLPVSLACSAGLVTGMPAGAKSRDTGRTGGDLCDPYMGSGKERSPQVSCYRAGSKSTVSGRGLGLRQKERYGAAFRLFVHLRGTALGSARVTVGVGF